MPSFLFFFLISPTNTASFTHAQRHKKHPSTLLLRLWKDGKSTVYRKMSQTRNGQMVPISKRNRA